jgi:hypothetical protein
LDGSPAHFMGGIFPGQDGNLLAYPDAARLAIIADPFHGSRKELLHLDIGARPELNPS